MRETMLILHFLGLAMGLGTSFGFMFLGIAASKMDKEEARQFTLKTFALSTMGKIGIILLIITGIYLIIPFWSILPSLPFLIAKLILVVVLIIFIFLLEHTSNKAKKGDTERHLKKIEILGKFSMLTAILIVIFAVLSFR